MNGTPPVVIVSLPDETATTSAAPSGSGPSGSSPSEPAGALVTPRPYRDTPPPAPTYKGQTPAPPGSLVSDTTVFSATVPARGSVTVKIDFEGATSSTLLGYSESDGIIVTFRGGRLPVQPAEALSTLATFGDEYKHPVNGDLVIKNPTAMSAAVNGFATITTRRHLYLDPTVRYLHRGEAYSAALTLSEATESDGVEVTVKCDDEDLPLQVSRVGVGRWTVSATASIAGNCSMSAMTTGTRRRSAVGSIEVISGETKVSHSMITKIVDEDRDGLIDELQISSTLTVARPGVYEISAGLKDETSATVAIASTVELELQPGVAPLTFRFNGSDIYRSGRWGPYSLQVSIMYLGPDDVTVELASEIVGLTAAYDYMQFERDCDSLGSVKTPATPSLCR